MAFGLDDERASGTLLRLRAAPVSTAERLGGKLLARYAVSLALGVWFTRRQLEK